MTMDLLPGNRPSVLFICTANICRSPMAEGLFKEFLLNNVEDWRQWKVESAGTWTNAGYPPASLAVEVMKNHGIDISMHRSRPITQIPLSRFRLILTMEPGHKEAIQIEFPQISNRVFLFREMVGKLEKIEDPIGSTLEKFEETVIVLENTIIEGFSEITRLTT